MVTQSKVGVLKPKVLTFDLNERKPRNMGKAFVSNEWRKAAQEEYDALIYNNTWTLICYLRVAKLLAISGYLR